MHKNKEGEYEDKHNINMKRIKRIDFYKKYTNEDSIPTFFGACMSLLTILTIFFLSSFEVSKYLYPQINHSVGLIQFPVEEDSNSLSLNFDIVFSNLPCLRNTTYYLSIGNYTS